MGEGRQIRTRDSRPFFWQQQLLRSHKQTINTSLRNTGSCRLNLSAFVREHCLGTRGNCSKTGPMWGKRVRSLQSSCSRTTTKIRSWTKQGLSRSVCVTQRGAEVAGSLPGSRGAEAGVCLWGQGGTGCCRGTPRGQAALCSWEGKPHLRYPWRDVKLLQADSFMMMTKHRSVSLLQGKLVHSFPGKKETQWLRVWCTQPACWSELLQGEIQKNPLPDILAQHKKNGQNCPFSTFKICPREFHVPLMVPLHRK